jgi:hypothetical protein
LVRSPSAVAVGAAVAVAAAMTGVLIPAAAGAQTTSTGAVPADVFNGASSIAGIAASSPANAWAVGSTALNPIPKQRCFIARWNGRHWRTNEQCPSPVRDTLEGVTALSTRNAWAVGYVPAASPDPHGLSQPLILRWNGIRWRQVPSPTFKAGGQLAGVTAVSPRRAWAVGNVGDNQAGAILTWNGRAWRQTPVAALQSGDSPLTAVAATSASNAWAVGSGPANPLILHWNGHRWTPARLPTLPFCDDSSCYLTGVAATSPSNAWAVGVNLMPSQEESTSSGFTLHWNGRAWKNVTCPVCNTANSLSGLNAVTAWRGLAWAVGYALPPTGPAGPGHVVILKWNGHAWRQMKVFGQPSGTAQMMLSGVAAPSGNLAWAGGGPAISPVAGVSTALLFTWNGKVWRYS